MHKEEWETGEGDQAPSHKLNITNDITDGLISSIIPSVKISCHRTICLFGIPLKYHS